MQTLPNGLKVLIHPMPDVGVATADIWIGSGAADETPQLAGVSHFLEHMLFKGTHKRLPGEMDQLVEGCGGILNAGTSKDFTHYYMTVPAEQVATAIDALGDAITSSTLEVREFEKERGVILEEISRKEDSPYGFLFEKLYETAFAAGPYRHSVLGTRASILALSRDRMWEYYRAHYSPSNMLLVVAGDVNSETVLAAAAEAFGQFGGAGKPAAPVNGTRWNGGASVTVEKDVREAYVAVAFPAPGIHEPEGVFAADVLQAVLADGQASRLNRELKEKQGLVSSIGASYPTHRHGSLFAIFATVPVEHLEVYREALLAELERMREKTVDREALNRAKKLLMNGHHFASETTGGAASSLGYYYTLTGSPAFEERYVERIAAVEADEVREAARRVLDPAQAVWVTLVPRS